jgi:hypothetical protein
MSETINQTGRKRSNGETVLGYVILIVMAVLISGCGNDDSSGPVSEPEPGHAINPITWMTDQIDVIGSRTLREISIPGSHDAGMNGKTHCWVAYDCNTQTQETTIFEQLCNGARFFDIRPARWGSHSNDTWYAGHFQRWDGSWFGCTGQSLNSILDDVRAFCSLGGPSSKELIILNFSHCYVVHESGGAGGHQCHPNEWEHEVLHAVKSKLSDYLTDWSKYKNPVEAVFGDRGPGEHVLLRFDTKDISTDRSSGVYNSDDFPIYNEYSNTEHVGNMVDDQFKKLVLHSDMTYRMFLLSYTLTLTFDHALFCDLYTPIRDRAKRANKKLVHVIQSKIYDGTITQGNFPNIIYMDMFETSATELSRDLNLDYEKLPPWWEYLDNTVGMPGVFRTANSLLGDADYSVFTGINHNILLGFDSMGPAFFWEPVDYSSKFSMYYAPVLWRQYVYAKNGDTCISRFLLKDGMGSDCHVCPPMPKTSSATLSTLGAPAIAPDDKVFASGYQVWEQDKSHQDYPGAWLFGYTNDDTMELIFIRHVSDCVHLSPPLVDYEGRVYVATTPQGTGKHRCTEPPPPTLYGYDTEGNNVIFQVPLHGYPSFSADELVLSPLAIGWGPSKNDSAIFLTGSGFLMAYDTDTGDPHFPPILLGIDLTGAVYSPIDDRVYFGGKYTQRLYGYTFEGKQVFDVEVGAKMSEPVYVQWDTTPPAYCICINTANSRTLCYASDGSKIYDQGIVGNPGLLYPPAIPYGGSSWDATKVYAIGGAGNQNVLARQGTLHHPGK